MTGWQHLRRQIRLAVAERLLYWALQIAGDDWSDDALRSYGDFISELRLDMERERLAKECAIISALQKRRPQ